MGAKQIIEAFENMANSANDAAYAFSNFGTYAEYVYVSTPGRLGTKHPRTLKNCRPLSEKTKQADSQARNEPCACGSGLKFKKCCLSK